MLKSLQNICVYESKSVHSFLKLSQSFEQVLKNVETCTNSPINSFVAVCQVFAAWVQFRPI